MKKAAIIMGSDSDLKVMQGAMDTLKALEIPYAVRILSAHRTPEAAARFAQSAQSEGYGAIIAAAGKAAHLAGAMAANTILPVIGVPMTVNAALLAAQIIALSDDGLMARLADYRAAQTAKVEAKDRAVSEEYSNL